MIGNSTRMTSGPRIYICVVAPLQGCRIRRSPTLCNAASLYASFQRLSFHIFSFLYEWACDFLIRKNEIAYQNIEPAVKCIEMIAMAEKRARDTEQMEGLQCLLSLDVDKQEDATSPCNTLSMAQDQRWYGREDILRRLEEHLNPTDTSSRLSSVALYGPGGIGKTQIALTYAYQNLHTLDAIFWISAEDEYAVRQS